MTSSNKTILIVDDNEDTRFVFAAILNHDGYRVIEAADGREGVEAAQSHHPDLILMDIRMPSMSGFDAGELIREGAGTSGIPMVAVTADQLIGRQRRRAANLFHSVLSKPVEPDGLREHIRDIIGDP
jgi:CheY-like chemotaxis protein